MVDPPHSSNTPSRSLSLSTALGSKGSTVVNSPDSSKTPSQSSSLPTAQVGLGSAGAYYGPTLIHGPIQSLTTLGMAVAHANDRRTLPPLHASGALPTTGSTVPLTHGSGWLLTALNSALAPARRPSTHGRALTELGSTTQVWLTIPSAFPIYSRSSSPTSNLRDSYQTASQTQLPCPRVCVPHRRVLGDSLVPVQEPRERSR